MERRNGSHRNQVHADGSFMEIILSHLQSELGYIDYIIGDSIIDINGNRRSNNDDMRSIGVKHGISLVLLDIFKNDIECIQRRRIMRGRQYNYV